MPVARGARKMAAPGRADLDLLALIPNTGYKVVAMGCI
jgi:hypothetical protein